MELLLEEELFLIDGGKNWWYIVGGTIGTVAGIAGVITGPTIGSKGASLGVVVGSVTSIVEGWNAN